MNFFYKTLIGATIFSQFMLVSNAEDFRDAIIPTSDTGVSIGDGSTEQGLGLLDSVFAFVRDSIFGILGLVAVGMFLYVGFKLVSAQGDPEELKKAFKTLVHVIIGMFIVAIAWALIKLVSGITF